MAEGGGGPMGIDEKGWRAKRPRPYLAPALARALADLDETDPSVGRCPSCARPWSSKPEVHRCVPPDETPAPWMVPEWQGDRWGIWPLVFIVVAVVAAVYGFVRWVIDG